MRLYRALFFHERRVFQPLYVERVKLGLFKFYILAERGGLGAERGKLGFCRAHRLGRRVAEIGHARLDVRRVRVRAFRAVGGEFVHVAEPHQRKYLAYRLGLLRGLFFEKFRILALFEQVHVFELARVQSDYIAEQSRRLLALGYRRAVAVEHAVGLGYALVRAVAVRVLLEPAFDTALDAVDRTALGKVQPDERSRPRKIDYICEVALIAFAVHGEHKTVEYSRLARARFAAYAKKFAPAYFVEVERLPLVERVDTFYFQLDRSHIYLLSLLSSSISPTNAALSSADGSLPLQCL